MTSSIDTGAPATGSGLLAEGRVGSFTDHMVTMRWTEDEGWSRPELGPVRELSLHPATACLHYGQSVIEGLKAHRQPDGGMAAFRPRAHARRIQRSAHRLSMPEVPEDSFVEAIEQLVAADERWLSGDPGLALYLRPVLFASEANLVPRPAVEYTFVLIGFVIGDYFGDDTDSLAVWVCRDQSRSAPGGTGNAKYAGNYAPTLMAHRRAKEAGCQQVVWLDAVEHRWVEEMGSANLFFVRGTGAEAELVTPELTGTFLPGITRDSVMAIAGRLGLRVRQERVSIERWHAEAEAGLITETFAVGTAAVVTAVGKVVDDGFTWTIGDGRPGPVTQSVHQTLVDLHHGLLPDPDGWLHRIPRT
ncbi:branched-chain amino acid aminotransferase [Sphaerisporangium sp. TRM90804]|uniref:branched-chain amino acid aminotransferase n=1 Tax=Sphaerisporangium sp. TRM90804 TaxID=3031113 RepID=UPI0024474CDE|nr:branched-chain amino acid aminotransferase [Sphaerisporangium sp. TRM90804]MDH2427994.1 branched-chain amino acid aminotransferase [Sphaerisporangium sp. TRM90804]